MARKKTTEKNVNSTETEAVKSSVEKVQKILNFSEKKRPANYIPQPGTKAALTLADFTDDCIFAELRRRGYNGELRFSKVIVV